MTLWLKHLEVENFAGIESASIDFDSGLNICHGPNELGKSTLVKAIRTALLLQHTAAAADELFDWHADAAPTVNLVFETEPQRIWRVRKSFGDGRDGFSYLEFSRDGQTFTQEAKGREVDGRLQELLQWGIESPGGKGRRRRGLPESFITTALLGQQADVTAILERTIDDDPDESGKQRLTEVLQAMAEDPIFRNVLEASQAKVDEAYTATGKRKSGRGSPWVQLRDQLQAAHDRQSQLNTLRDESESARIRIERLQDELLNGQSQAAAAEERKRQVVADVGKVEARTIAQAALEAAIKELERIHALQAAVQETQTEISTKRTTHEELVKEQDGLDQKVAEAQTKTDEAQARVRELESGAAEQQRRIREQELQNEILILDTAESELKTRMGLVERIQEKIERAETLQSEIKKVEATHVEAIEVITAARESLTSDTQRLKDLNATLSGIRLLSAKATLANLEAADLAATGHREDAERLQNAALAMRQEIDSWNVPTAEATTSLRNLETELRVAEEKLQVGMTAKIEPIAEADIDITIDGDVPQTQHIVPAGKVFEAKGEVQINIPSFGSLTIHGGTRDLVEAAVAARSNWELNSNQILEASGCRNVAELDSLRQRAATREAEAQDLQHQAAAALARAEGVANRESVESAKRDLVRLQESFKNLIPEDAARTELLDSLAEDSQRDEAELEDEIETLQAALAKRRELTSQLDTQVSRDGGRLEGLNSELGTVEKEYAGLIDEFEGDWKSARMETSEEADRLQKQRTDVEMQMAAVQSEATLEVDQARDALTAAQAFFELARQTAKNSRATLSEVATAIAQLEGEIGVQRIALDAEDEPAAQAAVTQRSTELKALPVPHDEVDTGDLADAEHIASETLEAVRRLQLEVREAEGALGQVGGQYIDEQAEQASEAVAVVSAKEHEVDLDYGAWGLLRDALKEAEAEDGVHLGNALVEPVSERMSALTAGRYGKVEIEPQLQTSGIRFGGESRNYDTLSIGTQEQLATLLRISIAEALDSFILMDDQLTQSDPGRVEKIREILHEAAREIQVIVFTCRPDDYVEVGDDLDTRVVDLAKQVSRRMAVESAAPRPA